MKRKEILKFVKTNHSFVLLWTSQVLSQITLNMINFVMALRIYERTGSTLAVSFLWVFYYLPAFFLGPFSGFFVDLWKRRKVLLVTNLLQALTVLLFLATKDGIYLIYPIVFLYSLLNQFYNPAEAASIPWLVKKKDLPLANSLFMLTSQSALVLGLGASGLLIRFFGQNNPVILSSLALFWAAVAVYFLPKNEPERGSWLSSFSQFWEEIKAGYSFIKDNRIVLFPLLLMITFQVLLVVLGVTVPVFSRQLLQISLQDAGPLLIVPLGLGALNGVYLLTRLAGKVRKKDLIKRGLSLVFLVLLSFALVLPLFSRFRPVLAAMLMYVLGLAGILILIPNQTLVQERTPAKLRGRVYGALGFFGNLVTLPFLLFTASIVDIVGIKIFIFLATGIVFTILLLFEKVENYILYQINERYLARLDKKSLARQGI